MTRVFPCEQYLTCSFFVFAYLIPESKNNNLTNETQILLNIARPRETPLINLYIYRTCVTESNHHIEILVSSRE